METPPPSVAVTRPKPSLPPNYVTLKQLQELRLKEKQDEEEGRLRELKVAREEKAPVQRQPHAAEVEEIGKNPRRGRQLPSAVPKKPSPNPPSQKAHSPVRSNATVEVATAGDKNTDGKPRRKKRAKKTGNRKPSTEKETKICDGLEPIATVRPPAIPILLEKGPGEKHRDDMNRGGAETFRRVAETGVNLRIAGAETSKRTYRGRQTDREQIHRGSGWRGRVDGRDGSGLVWVRKAKPSEIIPAGASR